MRSIEILLVLANLLTFFVFALPVLRAVHWLGSVVLIALLLAISQVLIEGPRWQMLPAYALAGLFFLLWLLQIIQGATRPTGRRWTKRLAAILGVGLGVLGLAVSIVLPIILPVFHFPPPTGPYEIGTLTYHWVDADRPEVFSADPNDHRELMVQIWYPAKKDPSAPRAPWVQDADAVAPALARLLFHVPEFSVGHFKYVTGNAMASAPMADEEPSYPVLIFLHGFLGFRQQNTFQVEELVSHGYIVVGIDQPYAAADVVFPDGRQVEGWGARLVPLVGQSIIPVETAPILNGHAFAAGIISYLAQDISFTLDQLAVLNQADPNGILRGRLDLQRAGIFGMSLGGIVGGEACRLDVRLRAFVVEDAPLPADVVKAGLQQPTMWISRDAETMQLEGWSQTDPDAGIEVHQTSMRAVFASLPGDGYLVLVGGMFHLNLTDYPLLSPLMPLTGLTGPIDAQRAHSIANAYSLAFFDHELKGQPAELLDGLLEHYPEMHFETRQP